MSIVAVIVKVMPEAPDTNLEEIQDKAKTTLESQGALNLSFTQEEIAFGLKAVMIKFAWPEEKDTDLIETSLQKIPHISSVSIEDCRRAFG